MAKHPKKPFDPRSELTFEERELFLDAFYQGEEALFKTKDTPVIASHQHSPVMVDDPLDDNERELFVRAVTQGFREGTYVHHKPRSDAPSVIARTKKHNLVDATIDLHGFTVEDAVFALNRFIEREKKRGSKTLLIIHGIGTGVLKNAVWSAVDIHPMVDSFQRAAGKLGGQGAMVVRINRKRRA